MALGSHWLPWSVMLLSQGEPHFSPACLTPLYLSCSLGNQRQSWVTVGSVTTTPLKRPAGGSCGLTVFKVVAYRGPAGACAVCMVSGA